MENKGLRSLLDFGFFVVFLGGGFVDFVVFKNS